MHILFSLIEASGHNRINRIGCLAIDVRRYNAIVDGPSEGGAFVVVFEGYDSKEVVAREAIHLRVPEDDVGYQGMAAVQASMAVCKPPLKC
jgi:hypothetical protein